MRAPRPPPSPLSACQQSRVSAERRVPAVRHGLLTVPTPALHIHGVVVRRPRRTQIAFLYGLLCLRAQPASCPAAAATPVLKPPALWEDQPLITNRDLTPSAHKNVGMRRFPRCVTWCGIPGATTLANLGMRECCYAGCMKSRAIPHGVPRTTRPACRHNACTSTCADRRTPERGTSSRSPSISAVAQAFPSAPYVHLSLYDGHSKHSRQMRQGLPVGLRVSERTGSENRAPGGGPNAAQTDPNLRITRQWRQNRAQLDGSAHGHMRALTVVRAEEEVTGPVASRRREQPRAHGGGGSPANCRLWHVCCSPRLCPTGGARRPFAYAQFLGQA